MTKLGRIYIKCRSPQYVYLCTNSLLFGSQSHVNCIAVQQPAGCKVFLILLIGQAINCYAICVQYYWWYYYHANSGQSMQKVIS